MTRTVLKVVLLVGLLAAAVWFGVGKRVLSRGKTAASRAAEAHGADASDTR